VGAENLHHSGGIVHATKRPRQLPSPIVAWDPRPQTHLMRRSPQDEDDFYRYMHKVEREYAKAKRYLVMIKHLIESS